MQPAGQLAQLAARRAGPARAPARASGGPARASAQPARSARSSDWVEHHEPLLGAVVQVAPDPAALLVGGVQEPRARRGDLRLARAQRRLVAAALELGGGARGEDAQDRELLLPGVHLGAGEHAHVADRRALGPVHGHAEVAVEPVADDERVTREAPHGARRVADDVDALDRLARRVGQRVLVALGEQIAPGPAREDPRARRRLARRRARRRRRRRQRRPRRGSAPASAGTRRRPCRRCPRRSSGAGRADRARRGRSVRGSWASVPWGSGTPDSRPRTAGFLPPRGESPPPRAGAGAVEHAADGRRHAGGGAVGRRRRRDGRRRLGPRRARAALVLPVRRAAGRHRRGPARARRARRAARRVHRRRSRSPASCSARCSTRRRSTRSPTAGCRSRS